MDYKSTAKITKKTSCLGTPTVHPATCIYRGIIFLHIETLDNSHLKVKMMLHTLKQTLKQLWAMCPPSEW